MHNCKIKVLTVHSEQEIVSGSQQLLGLICLHNLFPYFSQLYCDFSTGFFLSVFKTFVILCKSNAPRFSSPNAFPISSGLRQKQSAYIRLAELVESTCDGRKCRFTVCHFLNITCVISFHSDQTFKGN